VWYHYTLAVPKDTPEATPEVKELELTFGIIKYIGVLHPTGCNAMVGVRIFRFEHQIFPNNPDEASRGNGNIEGGEVHYPLIELPFTLTARGDSPGTSFKHDMIVMVDILPLAAAEPWRFQDPTLAKLGKLFGIGGRTDVQLAAQG